MLDLPPPLGPMIATRSRDVTALAICPSVARSCATGTYRVPRELTSGRELKACLPRRIPISSEVMTSLSARRPYDRVHLLPSAELSCVPGRPSPTGRRLARRALVSNQGERVAHCRKRSRVPMPLARQAVGGQQALTQRVATPAIRASLRAPEH